MPSAFRPLWIPVSRVLVTLVLVTLGCDSKPAAGPSAPAAAPNPSEAGPSAEEPSVPGEAEASPAPGEAKGVGALVDGYRAPGEAEGSPESAAVPAESPTEVPGSALGPLPPGPLAVVGGVEIPMSAFREIYELKIAKYADRGRAIPATADRRYRKSITERLIEQELILQEAKRLGVDYDPAALKEREEAQRRGIRDWTKHLQRRGETEASLRAMVVAELREKAILEAQGRLTVSAAEVDADYEKIKENWKSDEPRVRAAHILVAIGPKRSPGSAEPSAADLARWEAEAEKTAKEVHAEVTRPGADFAAVAKARSTGPSAEKGGDIGIFTADRMVEEFSEVAFRMKVGEISDPVKTKFGFHIIKLTGKWPAGILPKDALEDQILERLTQRALHRERRDMGERLRRDAVVVDNMLPTLGPEPKRGRRGRRGRHDEGKAESKAEGEAH